MRIMRLSFILTAILSLLVPISYAQSAPIGTQVQMGLKVNSQGQDEVVVQVIPTNGGSLADVSWSGDVAVYYSPNQYVGTPPSQLGCIATITAGNGTCLWNVDPYGQYWVQGVFGGIYDPNTGQLAYAPSASQIYHILGGPGVINVMPY
jgi:hypothetical protein